MQKETETKATTELQIKQKLEFFLEERGFLTIPSNVPEFTIYFKIENNLINIIHVILPVQGQILTVLQYEHIKETIVKLFQEKGISNIHVLSLLVNIPMDQAKEIMNQDPFCWYIDGNQEKILLFENQVIDFYGMKRYLEDVIRMQYQPEEPEKKATILDRIKGLHPVTISLIVINVILFLICTFTGELLYNVGELNAQRVFIEGEYYRILTCMFLHGDLNHLFSNMILLYYLGEIVEKNIGHVRFAILYFLSGIAGGFLSMEYALYCRNLVSSIGASGAIFGVAGALLWLAIAKKGKLEYMNLGKVLFFILFSLYNGFTGTNIDNAAHIGGLIAGVILTLVMTFHQRKNRQSEG